MLEFGISVQQDTQAGIEWCTDWQTPVISTQVDRDLHFLLIFIIHLSNCLTNSQGPVLPLPLLAPLLWFCPALAAQPRQPGAGTEHPQDVKLPHQEAERPARIHGHSVAAADSCISVYNFSQQYCSCSSPRLYWWQGWALPARQAGLYADQAHS